MKIRGVRLELLDLMCQVANANHPNEFVGVVLEEDGIISELNLLPGTTSGEGHANLHYDMMPLDPHVAGSAHSHPNGALQPSDADLRFFPSIGRYHFIIGSPYTRSDWRCYHADGTPATIEVIP
ncbi:MAG: Mov34/MPN/PAD-1 family protein [Methanomicrobiales archaeon]